ncbi:hypothetical protein PANA5342_2236 [Pantoea ananatis LMG 5342]|nr:hypothetical protein PANA5342_2236 [Pantoea ananatis LMG 5342]
MQRPPSLFSGFTIQRINAHSRPVDIFMASVLQHNVMNNEHSIRGI